jgi:CDP-glycerol glycerophosphotransferase
MAEEPTADHPAAPLLSVVIPIYNVERYLAECLQSVVDQDVDDVEIVMVDDGSTDNSTSIAKRWAADDTRFRLVRQDNHGLGHARNTGLEHATGRYVAFLDSDDIVPSDAYRRMIAVLEETGSDFATGNVLRFDGGGRQWQAPLYKGMAKVEQRATHVSVNHDLLRDHLAPNKVWRTSFWHDSGLRFPVGVLYEDVPTIIPAHVQANAVDVVPVVAALWRIRDQGDSSITQSRNRDVRHLHDRVDAVAAASRFIAERAGQDLKAAYDTLVLRRDLRWYVDLYPEVAPVYQEELSSAIGRFIALASPEALRRTPVAMRIAYALLAGDDRDDFAAYVDMRRAGAVGDLPVAVRDGRAVVQVDLPSGNRLPDDVCDVTDELLPVSRVSNIGITDRHLEIEGWAYIPRLPVDEPATIRLWLDGATRTVPAEVTQCGDERAAPYVGAPQHEIGRVGFRARVPLRRFKRRWRRSNAAWTVMVSVTQAGITSTVTVTKPEIGAAERPLMVELQRGRWLRVCWTNAGLTCRYRAESVLLTDTMAAEDALVLALRTAVTPGDGAQLQLRGSTSTASRSYPVTPDRANGATAVARVPVADLVGTAGDAATQDNRWSLMYRPTASSNWQRVLDPIGLGKRGVRTGDDELVTRRSRTATVDIVHQPWAPSITMAEWRENARLAIRLSSGHGPAVNSVALKARKHEERVSVSVANCVDTWVEFPAGGLDRFGAAIPLRAGTWDLVAETPAGDVPLQIDAGLLASLPLEVVHHGRTYVLTDRRGYTVSLVVETDLAWDERGAQNQSRLRTLDYPQAKTGLRDVVFYESYFGKQFSDSPREIFKELVKRDTDVQHVVAVRDQQFEVPEGARAVRYRSREYFEALARSRYVVVNTHLPSCFRRAHGQVVLQTWHGVGTKKIGLDMNAVHFANKSYLNNIRSGESDNWDYLVSPNPFTSEILTRAFAYRGTLLETGVPRNDLFHRPDRAEVATATRRRLGIEQDTRVVLYAPTWRDNVSDSAGRYRLDLRWNLHEAARKLGDEYAIVFRKHSNVVDRLRPGSSRVVDASDYPDVQELLLVADVLVSDYSTLMCDFANTGRPMLFFTYDLTNYRDVVRGFYFDFENEVPGPLITDEADLVPAILDAESIRAGYEAKYQAFADRFCPWDDGGATTRVVDAVFDDR